MGAEMGCLWFRSRAGVFGTALLLAFSLSVTAMGCSPEPTVSPETIPTPIPEGNHLELRPTEIPRQDVDTSRFVFLAAGNRNDEDGPRWYGYPTSETAYSINGSQTTLEDFERTLSDTGAYQFDVEVENRGEFAAINAIFPGMKP